MSDDRFGLPRADGSYATWGRTPGLVDYEDSLEWSETDPPGHHVRRTEAGYPMVGSSPAERAESRERGRQARAASMRTHPFEGEGPYCEARIGFKPMGSPETGLVTGWSGCGWARDMHPEGDLRQVPSPGDTPCACRTREDYDGERITTHCTAHCPRVLAGDWVECCGC